MWNLTYSLYDFRIFKKKGIENDVIVQFLFWEIPEIETDIEGSLIGVSDD